MDRNKIILLVLFLIMVALQIYVPASMVGFNEDIVQNGTKIKLEVAPLDPNDPFRGKYINLDFKHREVFVSNKEEWTYDEKAFVEFGQDINGFALPLYLHKDAADLEGKNYLEISVDYTYEDHVNFDYPFDRFYMDENKALAAENLYFESLADTTKKTYAVVYIKDGKAVLQDVQINGESIADLVGRELLEDEY